MAWTKSQREMSVQSKGKNEFHKKRIWDKKPERKFQALLSVLNESPASS